MNDSSTVGNARGPSRILIAGLPRAGKTTLAVEIGKALGHRVRHADDLNQTHSWSDQSREVAAWMEEPGPWVIEGVTVVRAIRKWMNRTGEKPADLVLWASSSYVALDHGQQKFALGCMTVWNQIYTSLRIRGVDVRLELPLLAKDL